MRRRTKYWSVVECKTRARLYPRLDLLLLHTYLLTESIEEISYSRKIRMFLSPFTFSGRSTYCVCSICACATRQALSGTPLHGRLAMYEWIGKVLLCKYGTAIYSRYFNSNPSRWKEKGKPLCNLLKLRWWMLQLNLLLKEKKLYFMFNHFRWL